MTKLLKEADREIPRNLALSKDFTISGQNKLTKDVLDHILHTTARSSQVQEDRESVPVVVPTKLRGGEGGEREI